MPEEQTAEVKMLRAALDVCGFTVHLASLFIPPDKMLLVESQIAAAHAAYEEATGEPSWDKQIKERAQRRGER